MMKPGTQAAEKVRPKLQSAQASVCSVVSNSVRPHGLQPTRLLRPWGSPGKNTGVGCHFLLQGIFPAQGSNLHLLRSPTLAGRFFTTGNSPIKLKSFNSVLQSQCPGRSEQSKAATGSGSRASLASGIQGAEAQKAS